eukprot:1160981-Pelagomonas_calceolata.AAC.6
MEWDGIAERELCDHKAETKGQKMIKLKRKKICVMIATLSQDESIFLNPTLSPCRGSAGAQAKPKGLLGSFMNSIAMRVVGKQPIAPVQAHCICERCAFMQAHGIRASPLHLC